jgi:flagellar protein FliO/FliZ
MDVVDLTQYMLVMFVLVGLLGAIGLLALAIQRGWILKNITGLRYMKPEERRLKVSETLVIDPRRRVVIVKCDDEEYVVLLGAESETLLSTQPAKPTPPKPILEDMS